MSTPSRRPRRASSALEHHFLEQFHPAVGHPVLSVNIISGGVAHNVVPGEAIISIDRRLIPGENKESAVADIVAKLDAAGEAIRTIATS